jgi:nucleotide-binding universal stress UspA family protein
MVGGSEDVADDASPTNSSPALPVVVGVDGSPSSLYAFDLAADEAALHQRPLRAVYAHRPAESWPHGARAAARQAVSDPDELGAQVQRRLRQRHPDLHLTYAAVEGDPVTVLVEESAKAGLTVVGNRGTGGYAGLFAGSVSQQLLTRGHGPVIVARGSAVKPDAPVVVAVDAGAPAAVSASVEFALAEAALRGVRVEALYAMFEAVPHEDDGAEAKLAAEALSAVLGVPARRYAEVELDPVVEPTTDPAAVLVAATRGAGLIVIGPHEGGSLRHLQPGAVGGALLREAYCPIAVIHQP